LAEWEGTQLESVDPRRRHPTATIDPARVIGCVIYPSAIITEPGIIEHIEGTRFALGEPDGSKSEPLPADRRRFHQSGPCRCPIRTDLRHDMWVKLMGKRRL